MGIHLRVMLAVLCMAAAGAPATAQDPAGPTQDLVPTVAWQDVLALLKEHPELQRAEGEEAAARGAWRQARAWANPEIGGALGKAEALEGEESKTVWEIEVELSLPNPAVYGSEARAARREWDAARAEAGLRRLEVETEVREIFLGLAFEQQRLAILQQTRSDLDRLVEVAGRRVEKGEARPMELSRLEIESARAGLELAEAERSLRTEQERLNLWLGGRLFDGFRVEADLTATAPLDGARSDSEQFDAARSDADPSDADPSDADPSDAGRSDTDGTDAATSQAARPDTPPPAGHPMLQAAQWRAQAAGSRVSAEKYRRFPDLTVGAFREEEMDARVTGGRVAASIPIWNWNSGAVEQARAELRAAQAGEESARRTVLEGYRSAWTEVVNARQRLQTYREEIVPSARATLASLERMYQVGEIGVMDLLDARRALSEVEMELLRAGLDLRLALSELRFYTGGEIDE